MDGYLYHDQLARMKFRLFYLLLGICKCLRHILSMIHVGTKWFRIIPLKISRKSLVLSHIESIFHFWLNFHASWHNVGDSGFRNVCDICSVSVANNFIHSQTASDYGYHSIGELARLFYCRVLKIKQGSSLPLLKQWEQYVLANHSRFSLI